MKNLINQFGTYAIVTVVTVLVWLYAEDANIVEYTDQTLRLSFVVPNDTEGVLSREGVTVDVDFNSSNGQYQQFIEQTRGEVIPIQVPFNMEQDISTIELDIRDQLERNVFRNLGINLTAVTPDRVEVTLEKIVEVTLEVRLQQETGRIKLSSAQIPNEADRLVTVSLPASQARQIEGQPATARVTAADVAGLAKGEPRQLRVPIELPAGVPRRAASASDVDVIVTLADDRASVTIDRRPILLSYPPSINERYTVQIEESQRFITAFELEGPREQIEQIKADPASASVWASVRLTNEEADAAAAEDGELTKAVDIIAPPGVVLSSDVVRVTVQVTPKPTP